jgi:hypothetical protein
MSALDSSGPVDRCRGGDFADLEVLDSGGGTDKIHNRVDRPDFVKMDSLDRDAVEFGFGLSHAMKHGESGLADLGI